MTLRRIPRPRTTAGRWRIAALLLGAIMLGAMLSAGTRFAYCTTMGPFEGAHCACMARATKAFPAPSLEATDCHQVVTVDALPTATPEARSAPVPPAPHGVGVASPAPVGSPPSIAITLAPRGARQRAGPARPAHADRSQLMVFLL